MASSNRGPWQAVVPCLFVGMVLLAGTDLSAQLALPVAAMVRSATGLAAHTASGQGYLGVDIRSIGDSSVGNLRLRETHGVVVVMVDHDAPAWKAGLREHDVVQSINGTAIETEDQLRRTLREMQPGRSIQIGISRDGSTQILSATLANRDEIGKSAWDKHYVPPAPLDAVAEDPAPQEPVAPASRNSRSFGHSLMPGHLLPYFPSYTGVTVDEITPQLAEYFGLRGGKGLLVKNVDDNSPAAAAGMHAGDVVLRVNGAPMATRSDWNRALHDSNKHNVSVTVMREHREQTLTVVPDSKRRSEAEPPDGQTAAPEKPHWLAVMLFR